MAVGSVNLPSELFLNELKRRGIVFMKLDREHGLLPVSSKGPLTGHQAADEPSVKLCNSTHGRDNTTLIKGLLPCFTCHIFSKTYNERALNVLMCHLKFVGEPRQDGKDTSHC